MKKLLLLLMISLGFSGLQAQYTIHSEYGDVTECTTASRGPFLLWWDKDQNFAGEANTLLDKFIEYRDECLNDLGMMDPPNALAGAYVNIYAHTPNDFFADNGFGCGVGTEQDGTIYRGPFLACGSNTLFGDDQTTAHELFHLMQYSSTSPGYAYSDNSQWYTEASANYYAIMKYPEGASDYANAVILKKLPHVPMWLSFQNLGESSYPDNWQRNVHQYAIHLFLQYMSVEKGVPLNVFTDGYYAGTSLLPQEYIANQIGLSNFRNHFIDFVAEVHNNYSFMTAAQRDNAESNYFTYSDPGDQNEYILSLNNSSTDGWFRPNNTLATTGWSYNAYKLLNNKNTSYTFQLKGDATGTSGNASFFKAKVLVKNSSGQVSFYDVPMSNAQNGTINLDLSSTDTEVTFLVASVPSKLRDDNTEFQVYPYEVSISEDDSPTTGCDWSAIAAEGENMSFSGTKLVRFGADGTYLTKEVSGGTICNKATFGDPVPNVAKTCEVCSGNASTDFIPDPSKEYYIDCPKFNLRLAATGESEDPYTTSTTTTGDDAKWKFVAKGNGSWHVQRAAGGSKPRLRTDNTSLADMQETSSSGTYTYYQFAEGSTAGTYYMTLTDGPSSHQRLQLTNNSELKFVATSYGGSWVSWKFTEATASSTDRVVHIRKRNAIEFALDGNGGADDDQNVHLWTQNAGNTNQQWVEINRGNGYYSYRKQDTGHCLDGGNGGGSGNNVKLWSCSETNQNQQWSKVDVGSGFVKLVKRNAPYAIDGGNGGAKYQNVKIWDAENTSQNLHWSIEEIDGVDPKSMASSSSLNELTAADIKIYPNPTQGDLTIDLDRLIDQEVNITMTDLSGKVHFTKNLGRDHSPMLTLDISAFNDGFYILYIKAENAKAVSKKVSLIAY